MTLTAEDLNYVFNIIKQRSGIHLTIDKAYLIESRLFHVAKKYQFNSILEFINGIKMNNDQNMLNDLVFAITTHESSFFRDSAPFKIFSDIIVPKFISEGKKEINIWSAACSSGQEPYSIAMLINDKFQNSGISFNILASDISINILEKAKQGRFSQFEIQRGMPITMLLKYFKQDKQDWIIKDELKNMIEFKQINLMDYISRPNKFDIVFCRNVLIYFDTADKVKVLNTIANVMHQSGILFLGSSESNIGIESRFKLFDNKISGVYVMNN